MKTHSPQDTASGKAAKFELEPLEERIAPSSAAFGMSQPTADNTSAMNGGQSIEPAHWHPLWPRDPWPPAV